MSPISALPPEVLCTIFRFVTCCRGYFDCNTCAFSQVCQSWRTAALENPNLWCDTDYDIPKDWTLKFLQRSRGANLDVYLSDTMQHDRREAILNQLGRVEVLRMSVQHRSTAPSFLTRGVQALSNRELPLRSLHVDGPSNIDSEANRMQLIGLPPVTFPTPFDEDLAIILARSPCLEKLSLTEGVNLLWNRHLPSSLTKLSLRGAERPDLKTFLDTLRLLCRLQHLSLHSCGPKDRAGDPPIATHQVDLPHLETVSLTNIDLANESFYQYLNFPCKKVTFGFQNNVAQPTPTSVLQYVCNRSDRSDDRLKWPDLRRLNVKMDSNGVLVQLHFSPESTQATNFSEWKLACAEVCTANNVALRFSWTVNSELDDFPLQVLPSFFEHLSHGLPLHNLQTLRLNGKAFDEHSTPPEIFRDLLDNLPELVFLEVDTLQHSLWKALEEGQKTAETLMASGPLPRLRYLRAGIASEFFEFDNTDKNPRTAAGLDLMKKWLGARVASGGSRLRRVELACWPWGSFKDTIPGFVGLADVVIYTNDL